MNRNEIDQAAYNGKEINSPLIADEIYWLGMFYIYKICKHDNISDENGRKIKAEFVKRVDSIARYEQIFLDSLRVMTELDKLIAPEAELKDKSKPELVEKIIRFQAILNGTLQKYDGEIPQMYHKIMTALQTSEERKE